MRIYSYTTLGRSLPAAAQLYIYIIIEYIYLIKYESRNQSRNRSIFIDKTANKYVNNIKS